MQPVRWLQDFYAKKNTMKSLWTYSKYRNKGGEKVSTNISNIYSHHNSILFILLRFFNVFVDNTKNNRLRVAFKNLEFKGRPIGEVICYFLCDHKSLEKYKLRKKRQRFLSVFV